MKNLILIFMLLTISMLTSCSSIEDDSLKTDDSVILSKDFQKISFNEVLEFSTDEQRIIFRYIKPNKRKELWLSKITHLKNNAIKKVDIKLIDFVENFIRSFSFDRALTDEEYSLLENDLLRLAKDANWSFTEVIQAFGSYNFEEKPSLFKNSNNLKNLITKNSNDRTYDCNCRWGWCPGSDCAEITCSESDLGCGFLFLGTCTKRCR